MALRELEPREKKLLIAGVAVMVIFAIGLWMSMDGGGTAAGGRSTTEQARQARSVFEEDMEKYLEINSVVGPVDEKLDRTPKGYDLNSELINILNDLDLQPSIKKMNPGDESENEYYKATHVDVDLEKISLDDLVNLLQRIDNQIAFVRVSRMNVKRRFKDDRVLDVNMRVAVYEHSEGGGESE